MLRPIYLFSTSSHPEAIHIPSLEIEYLKPTIDFSSYDALIITSKQVSHAVCMYEKERYIHMPALCVSTQSAEAYRVLGGNILEVGSGYGDDLAKIIQEYPKEMRWLYLRAEEVASDFVFTCQKLGYRIGEAVVYRSRCSSQIEECMVNEEAILIFTSPSSIECYLKTHSLLPSQEVVVIGKTTAAALPSKTKIHVAPDRTVQSCIEVAKSL